MMSLEPGRKLAHYEIIEPIGKGGMGEVYKARDTKLERDVAIKVLSEDFASDEERLARFEREAKLLASLNHPNIAGIYGFEEQDGVRALALELVSGPTIAERIQQGPVPVDEAIAVAKQVAEALEAGHEAGIIHRDLKPANIKLREDGTVKVLDYGLAKALDSDATSDAGTDVSQSPTLTRQGTQVGVILGTAAYMSPEQAKGKRLDQRTDVWAVGAVLFEMLTGKRPFEGEDVSELLATVIKTEPEWESLPSDLDPRVQHLLRRCLRKDRTMRLQAAGDIRVELEDVLADPTPVVTRELSAPKRSSLSLAWGASVLAAAVVGGLAAWNLFPEPERPVTRFAINGETRVTSTGTKSVAIAPDGSAFVYHTGESGGHQLFLRRLDELDPVLLVSSFTWLGNPFFSLDGRWVGFSNFSDQTWAKVSVLGGQPVPLFEAPSSANGASWGADNTIVFAMHSPNTGLYRGSGDGGRAEILTTPDTAAGEIAHQWPEVLPGGNGVLFTIVKESTQIAVLDLHTHQIDVLLPTGSNAQYSPTGHIVYGLDGVLLAVRFDSERLELTGDPVPVQDGVYTHESGEVEFGLSADGSLLYLAGEAVAPRRSLAWVDRQGQEEPLAAEERAYRAPRISPDGRRLAVDAADEEGDIWIWDFTRETMSRLTSSPDDDQFPEWMPDGDRVVFSSSRDTVNSIYSKAADGTGTAEPFTDDERYRYLTTFAPDGKRVVFQEQQPGDAKRFADLSMLLLDGVSVPEPLLASDFIEASPDISPDGRWLVYQSNATGQFEVYVRPFPDVDDALHQVSRTGGTHPVWAKDGSELFYLDAEGRLMSAAVHDDPELTFGIAEVILEQSYFRPTNTSPRPFDVSRDGKRFLMIKPGAADDTSGMSIVFVRNWDEELKHLVPIQD